MESHTEDNLSVVALLRSSLLFPSIKSLKNLKHTNSGLEFLGLGYSGLGYSGLGYSGLGYWLTNRVNPAFIQNPAGIDE
uniref:Uncharacterized protein n=1 Tax=Sphaeramia orbicularis TaxID=375764 RepID=A0A672YUW2_9TELE